MTTRRQMLITSAAWLSGGAVLATRGGLGAESAAAATRPPIPAPEGQQYTPIVTLNGGSLPWRMENGCC